MPAAGAAAMESHEGHAAPGAAQSAPDGPGESHDGHAGWMNLQVDAGFMFDDNVARGKSAADKLSDQVFSFSAGKTEVFPLTDNARMSLTGRLGGDKFRNYNELSRIFAGVNAEIQYRGSGAFNAPTFALQGEIAFDQYGSELRSGHRNSIGLSVLQPVTDRIQIFAALAHSERYGKSAVFINRNNSVRLNLDYVATRDGVIYFGAEYRRGDIISGTATPRLEDINIAKILVRDDAFPGGQFFTYRFEGSAVIATLGYNLGFGPRDSIDFSWRRIESTPSSRPAFATSPRSYIVNQYSIVYLTRF
jgi:hypothetical protein